VTRDGSVQSGLCEVAFRGDRISAPATSHNPPDFKLGMSLDSGDPLERMTPAEVIGLAGALIGEGWSRQAEPDALEHEGLWCEPIKLDGM
jgi:hypothetical protein